MSASDRNRPPVEARPPRMDDLARLPLFFALEGKRAVVAGGGAGAVWKVELLSAAGAHVDVYPDASADEFADVAASAPRGPVIIHQRAWQAADLTGAAIVIGGFENNEDAAEFAHAARSAGVPVNVIDKPQFCDFAFGAIVNRSPLVIGISTDGAAPVFGQAIRAKLEALIPRGFAAWAEAARRWRAGVKASGLSFGARRRFWQLFTANALRWPNHIPGDGDLTSLLEMTRGQAEAAEAGSVTLVGAGPGDPELLTLKAVRALQSADVILFDSLVDRDVLEFARREAKKMLVGKTGYGPSCKQDDINALMVSLARSGRRVVRLKGGDPLIFSRAGEEIAACRAAGIAVEVVPGITAAQGAAASLGVSLTHRAHARRLQYITGHDRDGRLPADIDWSSVADASVTTVVYMPKKTLAELGARAIAQGLDPQTPAIAVVSATRAGETVIAAPIAQIADQLAHTETNGPVLVLIGRALESFSGQATEDERLGTEHRRQA
jgi:uroporphyrin-III C-methyltransferase / precorrin-2 dehydrogenase / sirohydrochlorin ferrochelatase